MQHVTVPPPHPDFKSEVLIQIDVEDDASSTRLPARIVYGLSDRVCDDELRLD